MIRNAVLIIGVALSIFSINVIADMNSTMQNWYNSAYQNSNHTNAGTYEAQGARVTTFGGASWRTPQMRVFNVMSVQPPRISAGCSGIDIYAGGFSFISKDEIVAQFRAIGQNAQSLVYMMALKLVSPVLESVTGYINDMAGEFNKFQMDSCAAAEALVGGAMAGLTGEQSSTCIVHRMNNNEEDYSEAKQACAAGGESKTTLQDMGESVNDKHFVKGNLSWFVLMQDPYYQANTDVAELMMNIFGTVIYADMEDGNPDSGFKISYVAPEISGKGDTEGLKRVMTWLMYGTLDSGDKIFFRPCEDLGPLVTDCSRVYPQALPLSADYPYDGMYTQIHTAMTGVLTAITSDSALTATQRGIMQNTGVPVFRYLSAYHSLHQDNASMIQDLASAVTYDLVGKFMIRMGTEIKRIGINGKGDLAGDEKSRTWLAQLDDIVFILSSAVKENEKETNQKAIALEQMKKFEMDVVSNVGTEFASRFNYGN